MKNSKQTMALYFRPFSRYNLTELKNIENISPCDRKVILRYLANKIGTNLLFINRSKMQPRIFIVGIYSSAFLQKLVFKFLNTHKLIF